MQLLCCGKVGDDIPEAVRDTWTERYIVHWHKSTGKETTDQCGECTDHCEVIILSFVVNVGCDVVYRLLVNVDDDDDEKRRGENENIKIKTTRTERAPALEISLTPS